MYLCVRRPLQYEADEFWQSLGYAFAGGRLSIKRQSYGDLFSHGFKIYGLNVTASHVDPADSIGRFRFQFLNWSWGW